jgi:catechol 2,3-dioxygenase-like lactoylglutathione lyase family enzyme
VEVDVAIQRIDNIGVAVRDVSKAAAFFAEALGLATTVDLAGSPPSAQVSVGAQYLYLFQTTSQIAPAGRGFDLVANPQGLDHLSFTVDDIDETYAELRDRGVAFAGEPQTVEAWGLRLVGFRDPDGNCYYLVQPIAPR